jgi:phage tail tape-measure protein
VSVGDRLMDQRGRVARARARGTNGAAGATCVKSGAGTDSGGLERLAGGRLSGHHRGAERLAVALWGEEAPAGAVKTVPGPCVASAQDA